MKLLEAHRSVLVFLGGVTLIALAGMLVPGPGQAWATDWLTGVAALATAVMVGVRLALGTASRAARRVWQAVIVLLGLVCIAQLAEPFSGYIADNPLIWRAAGLLVLAVAAVMLLLATRFDPMPANARRVFWLALVIQAAAMTGIPLSQAPGFIADAAQQAMAAEFLALVALELYLLGAVLLVAAVRRELFVVRRTPADVGDVARYLYATSGLFRKVRHPRIGNYTVPGHKPAFMLIRFISWFPRIAPRVRDRFGIGLWQQFRDLCVVAFRHGLDAQVYYMFELYRSERRARASGYLTRYETKNGLFKVLTWQVSKSRRRIMLGDKLGMYRICQEHGIPAAPVLVIAADGKLEYLCDVPAGLRQDLFIKPRQSKGSRGTEVIRYADGKFITEDGAALDDDGLIELVTRRSKEQPILLQPRIKNHPGLANLADQALMRIRVVTCLDPGGKPVITHAVLSNLCKLETNWTTDIEFGAAIDLETGILGRMTGDKADLWLDWYEDHPVTHARVLGRRVPCWSEVRSIALAAHAVCSDRLLVGWDIAIGPDGAMLLEGNSYPDVDFLQRAHESPIGDGPLGALLYARLIDIEGRSASGTLRGPLDYDAPGPEPMTVRPRAL